MASVVLYNLATNAFIERRDNVSSSEYESVPNAIIYIDEASIAAIRSLTDRVLLKYLRQESGSIREMTQAEKDAVDAADSASQLLAARGGADALLDSTFAPSKLLRGILLVILDEINLLRQRDRDRSVDVAAATSLADLKTRWAARSSFDDRSANQIRPAIKNKIDSGLADA